MTTPESRNPADTTEAGITAASGLTAAHVEVLGWRIMHGEATSYEREIAAKLILERAEAMRSPTPSETAKQISAPTALEKFAVGILESSREHFAADVDGGEIQDAAEALGLLTPVQVMEPCDATACSCAEMADFPQECFRYSAEVLAVIEAIDSARRERGGEVK